MNSLAQPNSVFWQNERIPIIIDCVENNLRASIQDKKGGYVQLNPSHVKCGISGDVPHSVFIQKISQVAREKLAVFPYPSLENPEEIWIFEASPAVAPLVKQAREFLKKTHSLDLKTAMVT